MSLETTSIVGKKRKRFEGKERDVSTKLTGKLHHYSKEVRKAAKKAKAFETQRLVKRLKDIRKPQDKEVNPTDIRGLEHQLETLKELNLERIAHTALASKIRKDRLLSSNDALISALSSAPFWTSTMATSSPNPKVESRLLSSKILAAGAHAAVNGLKAVLGPHNARATSNVQSTVDKDSTAGIDEDVEVLIGAEEDLSQSTEEDDEGDDRFSHQILDDGDDVVDDGGWESGSVLEAEASDDECEGEDGDIQGTPRKRPKDEDATRPRAGKAFAATSTFLPSLSVGFVKGHSDSDFDSEEEAPVHGKKNRRGQRARQAIWEKKYGKGAKHVKKQQEEVKAATIARAMGKQLDRGWEGRHTDSNTPKAAQRTPRGRPSKLLVEKPMHPSWEAKKKLKEKESGKTVTPQGKKIVFT
ncbi:Bud-site selection protein [Hysterangium stoloniferum]|nr:Bud-site selection protein [Hysterangium stoloniferum]